MKLTKFRMRVLLALAQHPTNNLAALAQDVACHRPSISRIMPILQEQGLVKQTGRAWAITEQGQALITQSTVYTQQIEPLLQQVVHLAEISNIPVLAVCEVEGLLMIYRHMLNACSELHCAYGELAGWEEGWDE